MESEQRKIIATRKRVNDRLLKKDIVDAYGFGNMVIFELGIVPLIFLILFMISSIVAICLGIYTLSEWSKGSDYEGSTIKKNNFDIWTYLVSGLALLLGGIFFIMIIVFYAKRYKRFDETLLRDKSDQIRAAILTREYRSDLNESLPVHSERILQQLKTGAKLTADNILINGPRGIPLRETPNENPVSENLVPETSVENLVPAPNLQERAVNLPTPRPRQLPVGSSAELSESNTATDTGTTRNIEQKIEKRREIINKINTSNYQNSIRQLVEEGGYAPEEAELVAEEALNNPQFKSSQIAETTLSPISLSRSYRRRKSPVKKKKASPVKKKKTSPTKKKSTSSKRK